MKDMYTDRLTYTNTRTYTYKHSNSFIDRGTEICYIYIYIYIYIYMDIYICKYICIFLERCLYYLLLNFVASCILTPMGSMGYRVGRADQGCSQEFFGGQLKVFWRVAQSRQLVRQLVYTMFITINHASLHLW